MTRLPFGGAIYRAHSFGAEEEARGRGREEDEGARAREEGDAPLSVNIR